MPSLSGVALLLLVECAASQAPAGGCDVGPSLERASLVQRNHSSAKVLLKVEDEMKNATNQTARQAIQPSHPQLHSLFAKHVTLALVGEGLGDSGFPWGVLFPLAAVAALGFCFLSKQSQEEAFLKPSPARGARTFSAASGTSGGGGGGGTSSSPSNERRAPRVVRPPEGLRSQEPLVSLCSQLVVPDSVECTLLVPQLARLSESRVVPVCDLNGGLVFQLEFFQAPKLDGTRLALYNPARDMKFAICRRATQPGSARGFTFQAQEDSNRQAHLRALDSGFLLSATGRRSIRFRANSPGSINASDDDGQLLSYSDPASPDSEGIPRLSLKVGPKVDAGLMALCFAGAPGDREG